MGSVDSRQGQRWTPAALPADEDRRLEELYALNALGISNERLDAYTNLCARIFRVPVSFVSLLTMDKQWFKSAVGMEITVCDREMAFCGHTIHQPETLVIPDTWTDPRFAENPLVTGSPYIRFYAGAVLRGRDDSPIGSLCLVDHEPRPFSEEDRRILVEIAELVRGEVLRYAESETTRKAIAAEAMTDSVTGLPSARLLRDRLEHALREAHRDNERVAVFYVDLQRFRDLTRARGEKTAKAVLAAAGERLRNQLPHVDSVGRWSKDKFLIVAPLHTDDMVGDVVGPILDAFASPFELTNDSLKVDIRIGGAMFPADADSADTLVARAEQALDQFVGKDAGRFVMHDPELNSKVAEQFELERRLRLSIDAGALHLVYQPTFRVADLGVAGAEALMRWHDPYLGWVSPGTFIPLAEHAGLIVDIGTYALRQACAEAAEWPSAAQGVPYVAVNVSPHQLRDPGFPDQVARTLAASGLPANRLMLEVTESALVEDTETVIANMEAIAAHGVRFALDDFGTGYSSLAYLQRLPVAQIKVDRRFVRDIVEHDSDARIVQGIIALAHQMELQVTAEGVETREQALFLRAYGCDVYQGFHFARPGSAEDMRSLLSHTTKAKARGRAST